MNLCLRVCFCFCFCFCCIACVRASECACACVRACGRAYVCRHNRLSYAGKAMVLAALAGSNVAKPCNILVL